MSKDKTPLENEKQSSCLGAVISRLSLHVHNDIEEGAKWFKIPLALWNSECVYIMQEDRCVFVGTRKDAVSFLEKNEGKYCRSRFPL